MPDMTEFDQERYGAGYQNAEVDIRDEGYDFAERAGSNMDGRDWYTIGYRTCVNAWKEGVRL